MTEAASQQHWLVTELCLPHDDRRNGLVRHPWLLERDGREWTVATDAKSLHLFLGRHGDWPEPSKKVRRDLEFVLGGLGRHDGTIFVWEQFVSWLGECPPRPPCPQCQGTRRVDPRLHFDDDISPDAFRGSDGLVACFDCDDGTGPAEERPVVLCGVPVNANLLARGIRAAVRLFGDNDLVNVAVKPDIVGMFVAGVIKTAPVVVRHPLELWSVVVMPLVPSDQDRLAPCWPPEVKG